MKTLNRFLVRLRNLATGRRADQRLCEELESHLALQTAENIRAGMTPAEALRQAHLKVGAVAAIREQYHAEEGLPFIENLFRDVRYAFRQMRRSPRFAIAVVSALGLGIGTCTLVFAVVYGALINPYPYRDANRIVQMAFRDNHGIRGFMAVNAHDLVTVQHNSLVEDAMVTGFADPITTVDGYAEDVHAALLSGNGFRFLGVPALLGRTLTAEDHGQPVAVLGYEFCRSHYSCSAAVLGRKIDLDRRLYTIIGIMPRRFAWGDAAIFLPLPPTNGGDEYSLYLRAKKRVAPQALSAAMLALVRRFVLVSDGVELPAALRLTPESFSGLQGNTMRNRIEALFASVLLLLLIACANASMLMSARAIAREHEFGIRQALGAGRSRLARQLLTEAMLLAVAGGALGGGLAYGGIALLHAPLVQSFFPAEAVLSENGWVLVFSAGVSIATGLLFGIVPGMEVSGILFRRRRITLRATGATRRHWSHRAMVLAQVTLTLVLLVSAITTVRAFITLYQLNPGYDPHHVLTFRLPIPQGEYLNWGQRVQYYSTLQQRLAHIPGVVSASVDEAMATGGGMQLEYGLPTVAWGPDMDAKMPRADFEFVDTTYLGTMHIPLLAGREFTQSEYERGDSVALISRSFAHHLFGSKDPIGRVLRAPPLAAGYRGVLRPAHPTEFVRIIGVTGDALSAWNPGAPPRETLYLPASLFEGTGNVRAQLRTSGDPNALLETVRKVIDQVNPSQPVSNARTMEDILSKDLRSRDRWLATLFGTFAALALVLAVVGIYSVVSFGVTQRSREIGVRMALGARRADIFRTTLVSEIKIVFIGILAGLVTSIPVGALLRRLFDLRHGDGWVLAVSGITMILATIMAAFFPARRASKVDPMEVLRTD